MELQELVERINRWKMRQAGAEMPDDEMTEIVSPSALETGFSNAEGDDFLSEDPETVVASDAAVMMAQTMSGPGEYPADDYSDDAMADSEAESYDSSSEMGTADTVSSEGFDDDAFPDDAIDAGVDDSDAGEPSSFESEDEEPADSGYGDAATPISIEPEALTADDDLDVPAPPVVAAPPSPPDAVVASPAPPVAAAPPPPPPVVPSENTEEIESIDISENDR